MIVGIDLGTTNSLVGVWRDGAVSLIPNSLGHLLTPSAVGVGDDGSILVGLAAARAPRHASGADGSDLQALHGHRPADLRRREGLSARGAFGAGAALAQGRRRGISRRAGRRGHHHRPGLLQRYPAQGHQGGGHARWPQGRTAVDRADRGGARLWAQCRRPGRAHSRRRSRRRHLRRVAAAPLRGRGRSARDRGRQPARRRGFRRRHRRGLHGRARRCGRPADRRRSDRRRAAAPGRACEARAQQPGPHHPLGRARGQADRVDDLARPVRSAERAAAGAAARADGAGAARRAGRSRPAHAHHSRRRRLADAVVPPADRAAVPAAAGLSGQPRGGGGARRGGARRPRRCAAPASKRW